MTYSQVAPGPVVGRFVECLWTMEESSGAVQRIVPDGYPVLVLNLLSPFESFHDGRWTTQPVCFFAGQTTGPLLIRSRGSARILGVGFLPDGATGLLGVPIDELTDRIVPLDELSPLLWHELQRVCEPAPLIRQLARLQQVLYRFAVKEHSDDRLISHAVGQIIGTAGRLDVGTLAGHLGISSRQFERRFRNRVGLAPKLFSRIQRFQSVFHALERRQNWADAAIDCGYYDQAHLIRDFRHFAGEAPAALLEEADLAEHFLRRSVVSHFSNTGAAASL